MTQWHSNTGNDLLCNKFIRKRVTQILNMRMVQNELHQLLYTKRWHTQQQKRTCQWHNRNLSRRLQDPNVPCIDINWPLPPVTPTTRHFHHCLFIFCFFLCLFGNSSVMPAPWYHLCHWQSVGVGVSWVGLSWQDSSLLEWACPEWACPDKALLEWACPEWACPDKTLLEWACPDKTLLEGCVLSGRVLTRLCWSGCVLTRLILLEWVCPNKTQSVGVGVSWQDSVCWSGRVLTRLL